MQMRREIGLDVLPSDDLSRQLLWQRQIEEIAGGIRIQFADLKALADGPVRIRMNAVAVGEVNINQWWLSPLILDRCQKHLRAEQDVFSIPIPRKGRLSLAQRGPRTTSMRMRHGSFV